MGKCIIVVNAGSSSIKFSIFDAHDPYKLYAKGGITNVTQMPQFKVMDAQGIILHQEIYSTKGYEFSVNQLFKWIKESHFGQIVAIGHRVVHGGDRFFEPVMIDKNTLALLKGFIPLAPLHQPYNIQAIEMAGDCFENIPHIACFDTAFHQSQRKEEALIALPDKYRHGVIKNYGFHGLSYEYITTQLPECFANKAKGKIIVAHLGNGASLCAIENLRSVATTMGFSTLEGLMMGTRCGSVDPGVLLYLLEEEKLTLAQLSQLLYQESGLKGVSGISHDMQVLLKSTQDSAKEAVDLFCYHAATQITKLATSIQGIEGLVFTGGIGEGASVVRQKIVQHLEWLEIYLDASLNTNNCGKLGAIHAANSKALVYVIPTNEEQMIAQHIIKRTHHV
jgi:acetate kinase